MNNWSPSRRELFINGARGTLSWALAESVASFFPDSYFMNYMRSLVMGSPMPSVAFGQEGTQTNLVQFVIIDKVQAALFELVPGNAPQGATGNEGAAQKESTFRSMGLNQLFGDPLKELPETVSFLINNAWESGNGGHSLQNSILTADQGGLNAAFEKLSGGTGLLGPVGFSVNASANDSADAFTGPNARRMQTFDSVQQLLGTLKNAIAPILSAQASRDLQKEFDALVGADTKFRDDLAALASKVQAAIPKLDDASKIEDPIEQQVRAVIELQKAGVARNFMIGIPFNDTNGGGDLTTTGGRFRLDPFSATAKIANAITMLHKEIPNLFCVSTSDGGRSLNNGDQSAGFAFMTGPAAKLKNGIIGAKFTDSNQLGNNFTQVTLSNGQKAVARPSQWYATALKAMSLDPITDYVSEGLL